MSFSFTKAISVRIALEVVILEIGKILAAHVYLECTVIILISVLVGKHSAAIPRDGL